MKKIILHIGRHKSGTSSIQSFLYNNQKYLIQNGFNYPIKCINKGVVAHHAFSALLKKQNFKTTPSIDQIATLKQKFQPLFSNLLEDKINVISSEAFQNCDPKLVAQIFEGYQVSVVVYLRNEIKYLASAYAQKIHATDCNGDIFVYANAFNINYLNFLSSWEKSFNNRLKVRIFDQNYLKDFDVVSDFIFNFLNIKVLPQDYFPFKYYNIGLTNKILKFKLYLNTQGLETLGIKKNPFTALAEMAAEDIQSGSYCLPIALKNNLEEKYNIYQKSWAIKYFKKESIFDYSKYNYCKEDKDLTQEEIGILMHTLNNKLGIR